MKKSIIVFATSFLNTLMTHPENETSPRQDLESAAGRHSLNLEFRCNRDPSVPIAAEEVDGAVAVIADLEYWSADIMSRIGTARGGSLGLIARYGAGTSNVDGEKARDAGIRLTNTPTANAQPTAEWAVSTLMDIAGRRIPHHARASEGFTKEGPSRLDITGRTLGIIGTGNIGKTVAALLSGFGMKVLAFDLYPDDAWASEHGIEYTNLADLCRNSDFITIHASGAEMVINSELVDLMRPTTVLVNCARGHLVDNEAVYRAVRDGRIYGYGLDEVWNRPDLPLTPDMNMAVSPHVGSDTDLGILGMRQMSVKSVVEFLDGKPLSYAVN